LPSGPWRSAKKQASPSHRRVPFPFGKDPKDSNIRISPTRPPVAELEKAIEILAVCIKLASTEFDSTKK
jgi:DNA-binding transcriptional MocR family regulator